jgi:hypothetical protein
MRITIELSEAESRTTTIRHEGTTSETAARGAVASAADLDGGPVPEALLAALGGVRTDAGTDGRPVHAGVDGGAPTILAVEGFVMPAGRRSLS